MPSTAGLCRNPARTRALAVFRPPIAYSCIQRESTRPPPSTSRAGQTEDTVEEDTHLVKPRREYAAEESARALVRIVRGYARHRATPTHTPAPAGSSSNVRREGRNVSLRYVWVCYGHVSRRANHLLRLRIRLRIRVCRHPWVPSPRGSLTQGATYSQASLVSKPVEAPVPDTQPLFDQRLPLVREAP